MTRDKDSLRLADAARRLTGVGFERVAETHSDSFGDMSVEMHRGDWHVMLVRDRGQLFLAVSAAVDHGHDMGLWEACLDRVLPSLEPRAFELEIDALIRRLPDMEKLDHEGLAGVTECLRTNRRWRLMTRHQLGKIGPSGLPDCMAGLPAMSVARGAGRSPALARLTRPAGELGPERLKSGSSTVR
jgi:hypothetical protein